MTMAPCREECGRDDQCQPGRRGCRGSLRALMRACHGVAAIEFAFVLPVFLLMFFGVVELGRVIWTQASLQASVETAARCLAVGSCSDAQQVVDNQMASYGYNAQPAVSCSPGGGACPAPPASCGTSADGLSIYGYWVSASLPFTPIVGSLFHWPDTLNAFSCYPSQT